MRLLSCTALGIASYLAWTAFRAGDVIGCSADGVWDCGHVLHSRWSKVFGIPVSVPAGMLYASLLVALGLTGKRSSEKTRRKSWGVVTILALSAGAAGIWFICLQLFVLKSLCIYCISAHSIGLLLSAAVLFWQPLNRRITKGLSAIALVGVMGLITSQSLVEPPPTFAIDYHEPPDEFYVSENEEVFFDPTVADSSEMAADDGVFEAVVEGPEALLPITAGETTDLTEPAEAASGQPTANGERKLGSNLSPRSTRGGARIVAAVRPRPTQLGDYIGRSRDLATGPINVFDADAHRFQIKRERDLPYEDAGLSYLLEEMNHDLQEAFAMHDSAQMATGDDSITREDTSNTTNPSAPHVSLTPLPAENTSQSEPQPAADRSSPPDKQDSERDESPANKQQTPVAADAPPKAKTPPRRIISVMGGKVKLNAYAWPIVGRPDATHVLVELFDYTCPHCRKMNGQLKIALDRFGDQLAVLTLPVPLSNECNDTVTRTNHQHQDACELARMALAVWRVDPGSFAVYHNWMFATSRSRSSSEARHHAAQLVGTDALNKELGKSLVNQYIAKHVLLYKRAGQGTVPKLMTERLTLRGQTSSPDSFCDLLQGELKIQPVANTNTVKR